MKKNIFFLILVSILAVNLAPRVIGQKVELESDYLLNRDLYIESYQNYLSAKKAYLNQQTLERKKILSQNLRRLLYSRGELMNSYLQFLVNSIGNQLDKKGRDKLESWQVWLNRDEGKINQAQNLEDLYQVGSNLDEVYPDMEADIYLRLAEFTVGSQEEVIDRIRNIISELEPMTSEKGWVNEVAVRLENARQSQVKALEIMEETRVRRVGDMKSAWVLALEDFNQAQKELEVALEYIDEVLKRVE